MAGEFKISSPREAAVSINDNVIPWEIRVSFKASASSSPSRNERINKILSESYLKKALLLKLGVGSNQSLTIKKLELVDWGLKNKFFWASYSLESAQKNSGPLLVGKGDRTASSMKQDVVAVGSPNNHELHLSPKYWTGETAYFIKNSNDGLVEIDNLFKPLRQRLQQFDSPNPENNFDEKRLLKIDLLENDTEISSGNLQEAISVNKFLLTIEREKLINEIQKQKSQILLQLKILAGEQ